MTMMNRMNVPSASKNCSASINIVKLYKTMTWPIVESSCCQRKSQNPVTKMMIRPMTYVTIMDDVDGMTRDCIS